MEKATEIAFPRGSLSTYMAANTKSAGGTWADGRVSVNLEKDFL